MLSLPKHRFPQQSVSLDGVPESRRSPWPPAVSSSDDNAAERRSLRGIVSRSACICIVSCSDAARCTSRSSACPGPSAPCSHGPCPFLCRTPGICAFASAAQLRCASDPFPPKLFLQLRLPFQAVLR